MASSNSGPKVYRLLSPEGKTYLSATPGELGGNSNARIYGRLDCKAANRALPEYAAHRVFFANEETAIAAGYRPCGLCLRRRYQAWKAGGIPSTPEYPWLIAPQEP